MNNSTIRYDTNDLESNEAFDVWRRLMAPMFDVRKAYYSDHLPKGSVTTYLLGDIIFNHCTFNAQVLVRDQNCINNTPHHIIFQYYRTGGFQGKLGSDKISIRREQIAVCDLSKEIDVFTAPSDTLGLAIPRHLIENPIYSHQFEQFDAIRERALAVEMIRLQRKLNRVASFDFERAGSHMLSIITRLLAKNAMHDDSAASIKITDSCDETRIYDRLLKLILEDYIDIAGLTSEGIAEKIGISKATLYRTFGPLGGVMRFVREQRLLAVHSALCNPLDRRPLREIASQHGFGSIQLLNRHFRSRFGMPPGALRKQIKDAALAYGQPSVEPVHAWWLQLGQATSRLSGTRASQSCQISPDPRENG